MTVSEERKLTPKRFYTARSDGSVGSLQKTIEKEYGLPEGSVRLLKPSGKAKRSDATIASLRNEWEG